LATAKEMQEGFASQFVKRLDDFRAIAELC